MKSVELFCLLWLHMASRSRILAVMSNVTASCTCPAHATVWSGSRSSAQAAVGTQEKEYAFEMVCK